MKIYEITNISEIDKLQGRDFTVSKWVLDREYPYRRIVDKVKPLPVGSGLVYHTRFTGAVDTGWMPDQLMMPAGCL